MLLRRVRDLLETGGRVVVELAAPGVRSQTTWAALEADGTRSRPFRWSIVGVDDIELLAAEAGLYVHDVRAVGAERWVAVLVEPA